MNCSLRHQAQVFETFSNEGLAKKTNNLAENSKILCLTQAEKKLRHFTVIPKSDCQPYH